MEKINGSYRLVIEGVEYSSLTSLAEEYGIKLSTLSQRIRRGKKGDDIIPPKKRRYFKKIETKETTYPFYVNGEGFKSAAEACRFFKVSYPTYNARLKRGLSIEEALGLVSFKRKTRKKAKTKSKGSHHITFKGVVYKSKADLALSYGLTPTLLNTRLGNGKSLEEALSMGSADGRFSSNISIEYDMEVFHDFSSLSRACRVPESTLKARHSLGYDDAQIVGLKPLKEDNKPIKYAGVSYTSLDSLISSLNLDYSIFMKCYNDQNKSIQEAVSLSREPAKRYHPFPFGKGDKALLYFCKCYVGDSWHYKIGYTTKSLKVRFGKHPYKTLKTKRLLLTECLELEQKVLDSFRSKRSAITFKNIDSFSGYTELLHGLTSKEIESILNYFT